MSNLNSFHTIKINPLKVKLDFENPRFSLYDFKTEKEIITYLLSYENLNELIESILVHGFNSLGERIILLKKGNNYISLEGNRRIAALKVIFDNQNSYSLTVKQKIRSQISNFLKNNSSVEILGDVILNRSDADYKLSAMHISGLEKWKPVNKMVYYDTRFSKLLSKKTGTNSAIEDIAKTSPESKAVIKSSLKKIHFLNAVYENTQKKYGSSLPKLSSLKTDVITGRVLTRLTDDINLTFDSNLEPLSKDGKSEIFNSILAKIGRATWIEDKLSPSSINTRKLSTRKDWRKFLENDTILNLKEDIDEYNSTISLNNTPSNHYFGNEENKSLSSENASPENNVSPHTSQSNESKPSIIKKLKVKDTILIKKLPYNFFTNNDIELDNQYGQKIQKKVEIKKIKICVTSTNAFVHDGIVNKETQDGTYSATVTYYDQKKTCQFTVDTNRKKAISESDICISDIVINGLTAKIEKNSDYSKIVLLLNQLKQVNDISKYKNCFIVSLLFRPLIEYCTRAVLKKANKFINEKNLTGNISSAKDVLYHAEEMDSLTRKSLNKIDDDIQRLNSCLHDYKTSLSQNEIESIVKKYIPYIQNSISYIGEPNDSK